MRGNLKNTGVFFSNNTDMLEYKKLLDPINSIREYHTESKSGIFSTPIVIDNVIYVGSEDGNFYAYDIECNRLIYKVKLGGCIDCAACYANNSIYVPCCDGVMYRLNLQTGEILNSYNTLQDSDYTISSIYWWEGNVVADEEGNIYAGNDNFYMYCFDKNLNKKWMTTTGLNIWSCPAIYEDKIYFTSFDSYVYCLNKKDGCILWRTLLDNYLCSSVCIEDSILYCGSFSGTFFAINCKCGKIIDKLSLKGTIYGSACVHRNKLYIGTTDGYFYSIISNRGNLEVNWKIKFGVPIRSSPSIGHDPRYFNFENYLIYIGLGNGEIVALQEDSKLRRKYRSEYDSINSSITLNDNGISTCTIDGKFIHIPYYYFLNENELPSIKLPKIPSLNKFENGQLMEISKITINTPPIINTLDQIGIQSQHIYMRIVRSTETDFYAVGISSFDMGVNESRELLYTFKGKYIGNKWVCKIIKPWFETTFTPVPLDEITLDGITVSDDIDLSLANNYNKIHVESEIKSLYDYLYSYLTTASNNLISLNVLKNYSNTYLFMDSLYQSIRGTYYNKLGLTTNGKFIGDGTFFIKTVPEFGNDYELQEFNIQDNKVTVTIKSNQDESKKNLHNTVGIFVEDQDIEYNKMIKQENRGNIITASIQFPTQVNGSVYITVGNKLISQRK